VRQAATLRASQHRVRVRTPHAHAQPARQPSHGAQLHCTYKRPSFSPRHKPRRRVLVRRLLSKQRAPPYRAQCRTHAGKRPPAARACARAQRVTQRIAHTSAHTRRLLSPCTRARPRISALARAHGCPPRPRTRWCRACHAHAAQGTQECFTTHRAPRDTQRTIEPSRARRDTAWGL